MENERVVYTIPGDPFLDQKSRAAREIQEQYDHLLSDLDPHGHGVSEAQRQLAQRASTMSFMIRKMEARLVKDDKSDDMDAFIRLCSAYKRVLEALHGKSVQPKPVERDGMEQFHEYLEAVGTTRKRVEVLR